MLRANSMFGGVIFFNLPTSCPMCLLGINVGACTPGHGFEVIIQAAKSGLDIDYDDLDALWAPLHSELHYACLNDIAGLENPTSEMMSSWLWPSSQAANAVARHSL